MLDVENKTQQHLKSIKTIDDEIYERINEACERINKIKYFYNIGINLSQLSQKIDSFIKALEPWNKNKSLALSLIDAWNTVNNAAMYHGRDTLLSLAKEVGRGAAFNKILSMYSSENINFNNMTKIAEEAGRDAEKYVAWEVVRDVPGLEDNLFGYVIELYELGVKPMSFKLVNGKEKYVVDIPFRKDGKLLLGCYSHGDDEILYVHELGEYCKNLKPLRLSAPIRIIE
jgi:hypothetical protein